MTSNMESTIPPGNRRNLECRPGVLHLTGWWYTATEPPRGKKREWGQLWRDVIELDEACQTSFCQSLATMVRNYDETYPREQGQGDPPHIAFLRVLAYRLHEADKQLKTSAPRIGAANRPV